VLAEVLPIVFVYGIGVAVLWRHDTSLNTSTWYATPSAGGSTLSLVGLVWVREPDGVGGLGFLSNVLYVYIPLSTAFGAILAGSLADHIFYAGDTLPDFKMQIAAAVILLVSVSVPPLLVFAPRTAQAKRTGIQSALVLERPMP
jgi:hypothetical protein